MKVKLKCITAGFKFGDVVEVGKNGIDEKVAKGLVAEGLAVEIEEPKTTKKKD